MAERRAGGETGIQWVEAFQGAKVWDLMRSAHAIGIVSCVLCENGLSLSPSQSYDSAQGKLRGTSDCLYFVDGRLQLLG